MDDSSKRVEITTTYIPAADGREAQITAAMPDGQRLTRAYDVTSYTPHEDVAAELAGGPVRYICGHVSGNIYAPDGGE